MKNIIQTQLTEADRAAIKKALSDLETVIAGKMANLDENERRRYGSVNEQNKLIVNKAREYRQNDPSLSAPDIDWDEFESDYQARLFMENCLNRLDKISYQMKCTKIMHDYDNVQDSLKDYAYANYKNGADEPGYGAKVAEMKQFFTKSNKSETPDEEENT